MNEAICHIVNHFILWELGHYFKWGHYSREDPINILIFLWGFNSRGDSIQVRIVYKNLRYIDFFEWFTRCYLNCTINSLFSHPFVSRFSRIFCKNRDFLDNHGYKNIRPGKTGIRPIFNSIRIHHRGRPLVPPSPFTPFSSGGLWMSP